MSLELSFDKRLATLLAVCAVVIAGLLVAAGFLLGRRGVAELPAARVPMAATPLPATGSEVAASLQVPVKSGGEAKAPTYCLQYGAYKEQAHAEAAVKELKEKGVTATVFTAQDGVGGSWFTVRSGAYASVAEAAGAATELRRTLYEGVLIRPSGAL